LAVTADNRRWLLLNASPDLPSQAAAFRPLAPPARQLRGTAIAGVALTDGELDHVAGLLSLRENGPLRIVCTKAVCWLLTRRLPLLPALSKYCAVRVLDFPITLASLRLSALELGAKAPAYAGGVKRRGLVVGLRLESAKSRLIYLPALPAITPAVNEFVARCHCLLVDGTFWSQNEMTAPGLGQRTARDMGHLPIGGAGGTLDWLRTLPVPRKIYIHLNNTNPVLREGSRQHRAVASAGVEIAYDGMEIRL